MPQGAAPSASLGATVRSLPPPPTHVLLGTTAPIPPNRLCVPAPSTVPLGPPPWWLAWLDTTAAPPAAKWGVLLASTAPLDLQSRPVVRPAVPTATWPQRAQSSAPPIPPSVVAMLDTSPVARAQPPPLFPASPVVLAPTELHWELSPLLVSTVVLVRTVSRLQPALSRPVLRARLEPTALLLASQPRSRTLLETFATTLVFIE
jgi:hypothetical protein